MAMHYDLLVYLALSGLIIAILVGAYVLVRVGDTVDIETRKIRFAAATFTGILMLFVFTAVLYFVQPTEGKDIFEKALTAMSPLVGVIIGYLFSSSRQKTNKTDARHDKESNQHEGSNPN